MMKISNSQYMTLALVLLFIIISTASSYSQQIPIFADDVGDEAVAPISGLIALGLAVGGYLGIRQIRKQD
jgi:hypothetical protein